MPVPTLAVLDKLAVLTMFLVVIQPMIAPARILAHLDRPVALMIPPARTLLKIAHALMPATQQSSAVMTILAVP